MAESQEIPEGTPDPREPEVLVTCPECGADPELQPHEALVVQERLQAGGYLHNDISMTCSSCRHSWTHGVPRGTLDVYDDLHCPVCSVERESRLGRLKRWVMDRLPRVDPPDPVVDRQVMLVHRVRITDLPVEGNPGELMLHLKCPRCFYFDRTGRMTDGKRVTLVGYPEIAGAITEETNPYGWVPDPGGPYPMVIPGARGLVEVPGPAEDGDASGAAAGD